MFCHRYFANSTSEYKLTRSKVCFSFATRSCLSIGVTFNFIQISIRGQRLILPIKS